MSNEFPQLLIVVPIYKEAKILSRKLSALYDYLKGSGINYRLVLSVDESGDGSVQIVNDFTDVHPEIIKIVHNKKMGRGYAVREAWSLFEADFYSFIDADLATGVEVIGHLYEAVLKNGADIFAASRFIQGAEVIRPRLRNIVSIIYNSMLRFFFDEDIKDHQCGFKIITSRTKHMVLRLTSEDSWFWDAELLVIASKYGLRVKEFPVRWKEEKYRRTSIKRLINDVELHGMGILRLAKRLNKKQIDELRVRVPIEAGQESAK